MVRRALFTGLLLGPLTIVVHYALDVDETVEFVLAAVSLCVFLYVESKATDAILPLHLFRIPTFRVASLASFVMSMAFLGVVMFMPLYMQVVQGVSATQSGFSLLPLMGGLIVSSILSGRLVTRTGRMKTICMRSSTRSSPRAMNPSSGSGCARRASRR